MSSPISLSKFDIWCVRQVQHLLSEPCSINYLDTYDRYLNGCATEEEVAAAREADCSLDWGIVSCVVSSFIYGVDLPWHYKGKRFKEAYVNYLATGEAPND